MKMTAPASHDQSMAFFSNVCSNLCHQVIKESNETLYDDQDLIKNEKEKAARRRMLHEKWPHILLVGLVILFFVYVTFFNKEGSSERPFDATLQLQEFKSNNPSLNLFPKDKKEPAEVVGIYTNNEYQKSVVEKLQNSEQQHIADLLQQIDSIILAFPSKDKMPVMQLQWGIGGVGFSLTDIASHNIQAMPIPSKLTLGKIKQTLESATYPNTKIIYAAIEEDWHGESNNNVLLVETALRPYINYVLDGGLPPTFINADLSDQSKLIEPLNVLNLIFSHHWLMPVFLQTLPSG
jgi:hypothetical protein